MTLWELAGESSRCWHPLTYMYVSEGSGEVKYVGTTGNLRNRLVQDGAPGGKLELGARGKQSTDSGDKKDPSEKERWRKHKNVEEMLTAAGVRVHVLFDATWWEHWLCTAPPWNKREERRDADAK